MKMKSSSADKNTQAFKMFLQKLGLEKAAQAGTVRATGGVKTKWNKDSVGEKKIEGIKGEWSR